MSLLRSLPVCHVIKAIENEATKQATPYKSKTKTLSRSRTTKQWCQLENEPFWLENEKPQLENEAYVKSEALLTHHQLQSNPSTFSVNFKLPAPPPPPQHPSIMYLSPFIELFVSMVGLLPSNDLLRVIFFYQFLRNFYFLIDGRSVRNIIKYIIFIFFWKFLLFAPSPPPPHPPLKLLDFYLPQSGVGYLHTGGRWTLNT